jgi:hypothetical protein
VYSLSGQKSKTFTTVQKGYMKNIQARNGKHQTSKTDGRGSAVTQPKAETKAIQCEGERSEILRWLDAMPEEFESPQNYIKIPVTLTMDVCSLLTYTRGAKARETTLEEILSVVLNAEDLPFEDRGYLTEIEAETAGRESRKL